EAGVVLKSIGDVDDAAVLTLPGHDDGAAAGQRRGGQVRVAHLAQVLWPPDPGGDATDVLVIRQIRGRRKLVPVAAHHVLIVLPLRRDRDVDGAHEGALRVDLHLTGFQPHGDGVEAGIRVAGLAVRADDRL